MGVAVGKLGVLLGSPQGLLLAAVEHLAGACQARGIVTKAWHANLASTWWLNEENRSVFPESFTG